jgi:hypothetical protein
MQKKYKKITLSPQFRICCFSAPVPVHHISTKFIPNAFASPTFFSSTLFPSYQSLSSSKSQPPHPFPPFRKPTPCYPRREKADKGPRHRRPANQATRSLSPPPNTEPNPQNPTLPTTTCSSTHHPSSKRARPRPANDTTAHHQPPLDSAHVASELAGAASPHNALALPSRACILLSTPPAQSPLPVPIRSDAPIGH